MKVATAALLLFLAGVATGCARADGDAWTALVANQHEQADAFIDRGQYQEARRVLTSIIETGPAAHPYRRPVLQDAHFRLAQLALNSGDVTGAEQQAEAGLKLGDSGDLFSANLLIVRGAARERLGQGAAAAADYERALAINEVLLEDMVPSP